MSHEFLHRTILDFFAQGKIMIPGMEVEDFLRPVDLALEKIAISRHGIPLRYCNLISVTNGTFEEVMARKPSVLLLPYCSKDLGCDLRYKKGCRSCGECSVGIARSLGREKDMKVICITSFEDLMGELNRMKTSGVSAYIGCCCQPFFIKHMDDFKRAGIPGLLLDIDNTTCYELDQAREAYAGTFSSQTELNLDLLHAVLDLRDQIV